MINQMRVVAYCRVSTDKQDQINSLASQKKYFEEYINKNIEWRFIEIYADEGISGTNTKKRLGFLQMISDAEAGKFDLIITKEVSRFARNTIDSVSYSRRLKELGIGILFLNDNIFTLDNDSEFRLTLMSSLAQEESRKTSERVKWGQKRQMERGIVFGNSVFGYEIKQGRLYINEHEAEVVRLIFDLYLNDGFGSHILAHELENRGILSPSGSTQWCQKSLMNILKNEKYSGILKQRKEVTIDYLSHKKVKNNGREDFIILENNHEPIISREIFEETQKEIVRRRNSQPNKAQYSNRYVWSGKLVCARCNKKFVRKIWNCNSENPTIVWQCGENRKNGAEKVNGQGMEIGCNCPAVYENTLKNALQFALNTITENKIEIAKSLKQDIKAALSEKSDNTDKIKSIKSKIEKFYNKKTKLVELFVDEVISRADFDSKNAQYENSINTYNAELSAISAEETAINDLQSRLETINKAIDKIIEFNEYNEEISKEILEKIVVHNREQLDVYLSGNSDNPVFIPIPSTPYLRRKAQLK